jgi:hypothetical protein
MGYTHYFPQQKECPLDQWAALKADVLRLYDQRPASFESAGYAHAERLTLCDGWGEVELTEGAQLFRVELGEEPGTEGEQLFFNGDDREGRGQAHETMMLTQFHYPEFAFCKTARKPYDWFVVACLLLAAKHCPGVWRISTDGSPEDWLPVVQWLEANDFGNGRLEAELKQIKASS